MFGDLFDGESSTNSGKPPDEKPSSGRGPAMAMPCPPHPRRPCGLAGIDNRGATCYMNALLQTLLFTPEFRDSLFALGSAELGVLADKDKPGAKVRVIPIQLQRLFGRLLLLDQQSASTEELTDSFGWQNNEEFQQHDVQELNRILFSAIEDSLVGTSGENLISRLYHGISVNKITCEECGRVSEREEDFLDLTLAVAHYSGMQDTMQTCYVQTERMDGRNQYRCSNCDKLVDAIKSAKLRSLPPILTISLLRFSFNYQKCERYKEIGRYAFPQEIDMAPFCEKTEPSEHTVYELYSVLIHSGSTHGGHYHAYIKDIECLGNWTTPEKEIILLPSRPSATSATSAASGTSLPKAKADMIELSSPQELLAALLRKRGGVECRITVDKLCQALSEETGVSWNKRFKKRFGSVTKFVKSHGELFAYDARTNSVAVKATPNLPAAVAEPGLPDEVTTLSDPQPLQGEPESGHGIGDGTGSAAGDGGSRKPESTSGEGEVSPAGRDEAGGISPPQDRPGCGSQQGETDSLPGAASTAGDGGQGDRRDCSSEAKDLEGGEGCGCQPCQDPDSKPLTKDDNSCRDHATQPPASARTSAHGQCPTAANLQEDGLHWFDFNDSRVMSIDDAQDLPRQFSGRESAYMLFYRQKAMTPTLKADPKTHCGMPEWLVNEIHEANRQLANQREEYDRLTNAVELTLLQSNNYEYQAGALHRLTNANGQPVILTMDKRRSVADLKMEVVKILGTGILNGKAVKDLCVHTAKIHPAGVHLYDCISENNSTVLKDFDLKTGTILFLWDGEKVDGMAVKMGEACRPVLVNLTYALGRDNRETAEISWGFALDLTVGEMRALVSVATEVPLDMLRMSRVVGQAVLVREEEDGKTVEELGMRDGDRIIAEYKKKGKSQSLAANEAKRQSRLVCLTIENRCASEYHAPDWPITQVDSDKDVSVCELKACILSHLQDSGCLMLPTAAECRLRVNAYSTGLQPPLYEGLTLPDVGVKSGSEVIIEPGRPPKDSEIFVNLAVYQGNTQVSNLEVILEQSLTVQEALETLVSTAAVTGDQWHLKKTNWMGEPTECLQDPGATLVQSELSHGCVLILEEGRLPPKGFISLPIWLYPSPDRGAAMPNNAQSQMLQWVNNHLMDLLHHKSTPEGGKSPNEGGACQRAQRALLGSVELSQDATVAELKEQIQTLPAMLEVGLPSAGFLRLRLLEQGILGWVLRDTRQMLRRSKVTSATHIGVQILPEEENLSSSTVVLNICQRIPETHTYTSQEELVWDTAKSASPASLRQIIADRLLLQSEHVLMAKHLSQKFEWLVVRDQSMENKPGKGRGKRKGGGGGAKPKVNLKQSPYNLKDGDTIGVKDLRFDSGDQNDFATEKDIASKKVFEKEVEDKRKQRQELRANNASWSSGSQRPKKPEVGLTIRVADFR